MTDILTRGLYPFELVDSDIDWIGKIPSHWRLENFSLLDNEPRYLNFLIRSESFQSKYGVRSLDDPSLDEIIIPRPPLFEQTEIADWIEAHR